MKSLKNLFSGAKDEIDPGDIKNYYSHGAHDHGSDEHSHNSDTEHQKVKKYICPMKCEGDKTYDAPGKCPVCNMNLTMVG